MNCLRNLSAALIAEEGLGFVCIWRLGEHNIATCNGVGAGMGTVGLWLSGPDHQSGTWLIDGGWGGPPGAVPIHVRWNDVEKAWENLGFDTKE